MLLFGYSLSKLWCTWWHPWWEPFFLSEKSYSIINTKYINILRAGWRKVAHSITFNILSLCDSVAASYLFILYSKQPVVLGCLWVGKLPCTVSDFGTIWQVWYSVYVKQSQIFSSTLLLQEFINGKNGVFHCSGINCSNQILNVVFSMHTAVTTWKWLSIRRSFSYSE